MNTAVGLKRINGYKRNLLPNQRSSQARWHFHQPCCTCHPARPITM